MVVNAPCSAIATAGPEISSLAWIGGLRQQRLIPHEQQVARGV